MGTINEHPVDAQRKRRNFATNETEPNNNNNKMIMMMTSASMIKLAILALIVVVLVSSSFAVAQDDSDGPTTIQDLQTQDAQGEEADLQDDLSNGGRRLLKSASASASASSKSSSK